MDKTLQWLMSNQTTTTEIQIMDQVFYMREPTVADRDRFDSLVAGMDLTSAQLRTPMVTALLCNESGDLIAEGQDLDHVPAHLVEPLVDKARELFGLMDHPTDGETSL